MKLFATDLERLGFLLEAEAELRIALFGEPVSGTLGKDGPSFSTGCSRRQNNTEELKERFADNIATSATLTYDGSSVTTTTFSSH